MPFVKSLASKHCIKLVSTIISLSEIMPSYSRYVERKLLYIIIIALLGRQHSSYIKCTRANI